MINLILGLVNRLGSRPHLLSHVIERKEMTGQEMTDQEINDYIDKLHYKDFYHLAAHGHHLLSWIIMWMGPRDASEKT
jgi:hypothetical protein